MPRLCKEMFLIQSEPEGREMAPGSNGPLFLRHVTVGGGTPARRRGINRKFIGNRKLQCEIITVHSES